MAVLLLPSLDGYSTVCLVNIVSRSKSNEPHRISLFSGIPYNTVVITIPQRFQAVYGTSPLGAGVRLIPFNFLISFASVFVNILAAKARIKPIYLLLVGSALQLIGLTLFTTIPDDTTVPAAIYGYEIISGFGIGMVIGICLVIPPHVVETRDLGMVLSQSTEPSLHS